jgi:hypothetical protein
VADGLCLVAVVSFSRLAFPINNRYLSTRQ